jgi:hypothetical protein
VTPILKKPSLDKKVLKNYRPVSNISYVSKIMEKIVCSQIKNHLNQNALLEPFQSAYRELHSTETALLRVKSDIMHAIDDNKAVAVVLLDLSAAFDTVDHQIWLNRLCHTFGIRGKALAWISSYLQDRSFRVCTGDVSSSPTSLSYGIPKDLWLGLFSLFCTRAALAPSSVNTTFYIICMQMTFNCTYLLIPKLKVLPNSLLVNYQLAFLKSVSG